MAPRESAQRILLIALVLLSACSGAEEGVAAGGSSGARASGGGGVVASMQGDPDGAPGASGAAGAGGGQAGSGIEGGAGEVGAARSTIAAGNACPVGQAFGDPLALHPAPTLVQNGVGFMEGPVWISARSLLFYTNFEGTGNAGRIRTYDPKSGALQVFIEGIGANGLAVDGEGMIVAGFHEKQRVLRINPETKERSDVLGGDSYMGLPFNSVNDVVARADDHVYFTDPSYQKGDRTGQPVNASYHLTPDGVATRIETEDAPNGIALSPDGRLLYIGGSGAPHAIVKYQVSASGEVMTPGTPISSAPSDGMTTDCAGNVYLTTGGTSAGKITILTPDGSLVGELTQGFSGGTTNVSFGGADHKTLFVTTSDALYQVVLDVPGLP